MVKGLELIGGLEQIVTSGSKVFVKINHLSPPSPSEKGIVTHPVFVEAVLNLLKDIGVEITVGDDIEVGSGDGFRISGFRQMCEKVGVRLVNLKEDGFAETICNGHLLEKVHVSKTALDADMIINLPKLKTHSLCVYTGGIKNMYGTIPFGLRQKFHADYMRNEVFSQMLTDIFSTVKPRLTIMDGIVAMEGEGPAGGSLRRPGVILTSQDTVALDAVAAKVIGFNPLDIYTTRYATERGLGIGNLEDIEVVGEEIESVMVPDFKPPASASIAVARMAPRFLARFAINQLTVKPKVLEKKCTGCGECEKICPVKAIVVNSKKIAEINRDICIKCMCCHEVCRFNAIKPTRLAIGGAVQFLGNILQKLSASRK